MQSSSVSVNITQKLSVRKNNRLPLSHIDVMNVTMASGTSGII